MKFFITFLFITYTLSQYSCKTAEEANLPNFTGDVTFGDSIPTSTIDIDGEKQTVKAKYFKVTGTEDSANKLITIGTCSATTKVVTKILIFKTCSDDIATDFEKESGYDPECKTSFESPIVSIYPQTGETYYIVVAEKDMNKQGNVHIEAYENKEETFTNSNCKNAIEISAFPFEVRQQIIPQIEGSKPKCYPSKTPTLWYKVKGDGKQLLVSTCNYYTNFDTQIVIIKSKGDTCNDQSCLKMNNDGCGTRSTATVVAFEAENDQTYYIGVSGNNNDIGQYQLRIDYLSDNVPAICTHALPIQQIPFSKEIDISHDWPAQKGTCFNRDIDVRSVYLSFTGNGKEMVFSTCKSLNDKLQPIGTTIEIIDNCVDEQCDIFVSDAHFCGKNTYIVKKMEQNVNYILRVYCNDASLSVCPLTLNVYEKAETHDTCEHARILENQETYQEIVDVKNLQYSIHGCDGQMSQSTGLWYYFVHTSSKPIEVYTVVAMNAQRSKIGWIEFHTECMNYYCEQKIQGEALLTLSAWNTYQYLFIYPDIQSGQEGLIVQFINAEEITFNTCENALEIELPYTALHTFTDTKNQLVCQNQIQQANYYKFKVGNSQQIDASTCFTKTIVDTGLEITKGCAANGGECVGYVSQSANCAVGAATIKQNVEKDVEYTLAVYLEGNHNLVVRQYRMVIFTEEVPANSMCSSPTELNVENYRESYLVLNRYGRKSDFGDDYGTTRGSYFKITAKEDMPLQVRTCSSSTTTNSFIVFADDCTTAGSGDTMISKPSGLSNLVRSSEINCDIHGTYVSIDMKKDETKFIFVGPETFDAECFIEVEFLMGEEPNSSEADESEEAEELPIGWFVFGGLFYGWWIITIVLVIIIIIIRKKTNDYLQF